MNPTPLRPSFVPSSSTPHPPPPSHTLPPLLSPCLCLPDSLPPSSSPPFCRAIFSLHMNPTPFRPFPVPSSSTPLPIFMPFCLPPSLPPPSLSHSLRLPSLPSAGRHSLSPHEPNATLCGRDCGLQRGWSRHPHCPPCYQGTSAFLTSTQRLLAILPASLSLTLLCLFTRLFTPPHVHQEPDPEKFQAVSNNSQTPLSHACSSHSSRPSVHTTVHPTHPQVHQEADPDEFQALTKGDNNEGDDLPLYAEGQLWLRKKHIIGRAMGYLPYIGYVTIIMTEHPYIKFILIGVLAILVLTSKD
ncbi:unnamed protein product [Closterium sp. NIES-54]